MNLNELMSQWKKENRGEDDAIINLWLAVIMQAFEDKDLNYFMSDNFELHHSLLPEFTSCYFPSVQEFRRRIKYLWL